MNINKPKTDNSIEYILKSARDHDVQFIRLWFTDILGNLKGFAITVEELEEAISNGNSAAIESELGDVLFAAVNIARHTNVDPESALRNANSRFENRFKWIEAKLQTDGKSITEMNLQQLDQLWEEAKFNGF